MTSMMPICPTARLILEWWIREQRKEYYSQHNANYVKTHHEQRLKSYLKYNETHRNERLTYATEYRKENRDIINAKARARRALLKAQLNCEILDATNP